MRDLTAFLVARNATAAIAGHYHVIPLLKRIDATGCRVIEGEECRCQMRPRFGDVVVGESPMVEARDDGIFVFMFLFVVIVYEKVIFVVA